MDNNSRQPFTGQPMQQPNFPQAMGGFGSSGNPVPTSRITPKPSGPQSGTNKQTILTVVAIVGGLAAVTFLGLFIWMYIQWTIAKTNVDGQVEVAVASAVNEKTEEMENQFTEREKYPYVIFAGPADYGELTFEYPKTWSMYEAQDASNGGEYAAYLNPDKVYPVGDNINALRVLIKNQPYESYIQQYDGEVKSGNMTVMVRPINGENANVYTGKLPGTNEYQGIVAVIKVRDKTIVLQTDSMVFAEEFSKILDSVQFNR